MIKNIFLCVGYTEFSDTQKTFLLILFPSKFADNCNALGLKLLVKLIMESVSGNPDPKSFKEKSFTYSF